ncbi:hypothetical protein EVAR_98493_1 [Eumeta japonica]|uniref:Uncharacterized protein n=1 Tax=Eumeta variegata TaxID=151549 RepID=A0A4C1YET1_EUMVA|nr:hypothetical protein EVAR_98493_1 [Eumeta japonica]
MPLATRTKQQASSLSIDEIPISAGDMSAPHTTSAARARPDRLRASRCTAIARALETCVRTEMKDVPNEDCCILIKVVTPHHQTYIRWPLCYTGMSQQQPLATPITP